MLGKLLHIYWGVVEMARFKENPEFAPHNSRKDTKRWCKGKVGREHVATWKNYLRLFRWETWYQLKCSKCLKVLEYCKINGDCPKHGVNHGALAKGDVDGA